MKIRKVAGWSLLSTLPLGMFVYFALNDAILEFFIVVGSAAVLMGIIFAGTYLAAGDR